VNQKAGGEDGDGVAVLVNYYIFFPESLYVLFKLPKNSE
jgi:hypothetical protein